MAMLKLRGTSVETTPAWIKNSGRLIKINPGTNLFLLSFGKNLHTKNIIINDKNKYGKRTKNSPDPKTEMLKADNHEDKGGLAQKGTP